MIIEITSSQRNFEDHTFRKYEILDFNSIKLISFIKFLSNMSKFIQICANLSIFFRNCLYTDRKQIAFITTN